MPLLQRLSGVAADTGSSCCSVTRPARDVVEFQRGRRLYAALRQHERLLVLEGEPEIAQGRASLRIVRVGRAASLSSVASAWTR